MKRFIHIMWRGIVIACLLGLATSVQAEPLAYIPCQDDYGVSVMDTATNTMVDTVPLKGHPCGVAVHPDGTFVYVTWSSPPSFGVSVISTLTNAVVETTPIGFEPCGVAVSPDGQFVYIVIKDGVVFVISTATNTVMDIVLVGWEPIGVAANPNGKYVYVTCSLDHNVSVIDAHANLPVTSIPVGTYPCGVAVSPDGRFVYVANVASGNVSVIEGATNKVIHTVAVGAQPRGVAVDPDGKFVYVTCGWSNTVSVIDTATNTVVATVPVGSSPYGVAVRPDGRFIYVANRGSNDISVIEVATNTVVDTVPVGGSPTALGQFIMPSPYAPFPDDTMSPTGAIHAYYNVLLPNNENVIVTLEGYVLDELSIARDGSGIGVSSAHLKVYEKSTLAILMDDDITNQLDEYGKFTVKTEVQAVGGAVYVVELYATDTEPEASGGPNSGLVDETYITVSPASSEPTIVSVDSITYATKGKYPRPDKNLLITIAVKDDLGNPVANAYVSIDLKCDEKSVFSATGMTGTDGFVEFTYKNALSGNYVTVVTAVNAIGLTWDGITPENNFVKGN